MRYEIHDKLNFEIVANNYEDKFVKDDNVLFHLSSHLLMVTLLDNAGKRGKTVPSISIWSRNIDRCVLLNFLSSINYRLRDLVLTPCLFSRELKEYGLELDKSIVKAHKLFCPWQRLAPLKTTPKKWNAETVRRALANNQATDCRHSKEFDGMIDGCNYFNKPTTAEEILYNLNTFSLGIRVGTERISVSNSACEYSFIPMIKGA